MSEAVNAEGDLTDVAVALVVFGSAGRAVAYADRLGIDVPVLVDVDRSTYRLYGIGRGRLREVWGWSSARRYAQLLRAGRRLRRPVDDTRQLGGDLVVARDGRLTYRHVGRGPADRPTAADLVEALRRT